MKKWMPKTLAVILACGMLVNSVTWTFAEEGNSAEGEGTVIEQMEDSAVQTQGQMDSDDDSDMTVTEAESDHAAESSEPEGGSGTESLTGTETETFSETETEIFSEKETETFSETGTESETETETEIESESETESETETETEVRTETETKSSDCIHAYGFDGICSICMESVEDAECEHRDQDHSPSVWELIERDGKAGTEKYRCLLCESTWRRYAAVTLELEQKEEGRMLNLEAISSSIDVEIAMEDGTPLPDQGIDRDSKFKVNIAYSVKNSIEGGKLTEKDRILYQLPGQLKVSTTFEDQPMTENGVTKGYLSLDGSGLITIRLTKAFLEEGSSNIKGNISLKAVLSEDSSSGGDEVIIHFPGVSNEIHIHLKEAYTKIEKNYPKTGNLAKLNADGTLTFTVTLTPDADLKELTVTDTLGSGFSFVEGSFAFQGYAQAGKAGVRLNDRTAVIDLGEVKHNEKPVITYKVKVLETTGENPYQNTAACSWKAANGSDGENSTHVEVTFPTANPLTKSGKLTNKENGIITWTVKFNDSGIRTDLSSTEFKDTLGAHQTYTGSYTLKDEKSQVVDSGDIAGKTSFTYRFGENAGTGKYTLTYQSKVDEGYMPSGFEGETFTNEVILKKNGQEYAGSATVKVDAAIGLDGILKKEMVQVQSKEGIVHWKATIDLTKTSGVENLVFKDWCREASHMTFLKEETKVSGTNAEYVLSYTDSENIEGHGKNCKSMTIAFEGTVKEKIVITYTTRIDPAAFGDKTFVDKTNFAKVTFSYGGKEYSKNTYANVRIFRGFPMSKQVKENGWDAGENAWVIKWWILINANSINDSKGEYDYGNLTLYVKDTIPEGLTYMPGSGELTRKGKGTIPIELEDGCYTLENIGRDVITITYKTKVAPELLADGASHTFNNVVQLFESPGASDALATVNKTASVQGELLKKTGSKEEKEQYVTYAVDVNKYGQDLIPDSGVIVLTDVISEQLTLLPSSVKVIDGNNGNAVNEAKTSYNSNTRELKVTVPDERYVKLTYRAEPNGAIGSEVTISNTINMEGRSGVSSSTTKKYVITQANGSITSTDAAITLKKIDQYDMNKTLSGAKFALYMVDLDEKPGSSAAEKLVAEKTSGTDGIITFREQDKLGAAQLYLDHLYYYVETTAPKGYEKDSTKHYFMLMGNDFKTQSEKAKEQGYAFRELRNAVVINVSNEKTVNGTISIVLEGSKQLTGADLKGNDFEFMVYEKDKVVARGTNDREGKIVFDSILYDRKDLGRHIYEVKEKNSGILGMDYDDAVYTVVTDVTAEDGRLQAEITYRDGDIVFRNVYEEPESPSESEPPSEPESPSEPEPSSEPESPSAPVPVPDRNDGGTPPTSPAVVNVVPEQGVLGARVEMPAEEEGGAMAAERGVLGERRGAQTGDTTPVLGWTILFGAAALIMEEVLRKKRNKKS